MIEFQRKIMGDTLRNDLFAQALRQVIEPGTSVVADLGSGTGFLSFLARKYGAKECHLYEQNEGFVHLSKQIAKDNGIDGCVFHLGHSSDAKKPVKADIVISETLGNFAGEEHIIENMEDAKRMLKPGGVLIPQNLTQWVAPVTSDRLWKDVNIWDDLQYGIDFAAAKEATLNNMYVKTVRNDDLMQDAVQKWDFIDFREASDSLRFAHLEWDIVKPTTIYGFALWWESDLLPGITLSTAPDAPLTHWEQIYLPVLSPITVSKGQTVSLALTSNSGHETGLNVEWGIEVEGMEKQELSILKGHLE